MTIKEDLAVGCHGAAVDVKHDMLDILDAHETTETDQTILEKLRRTRDLSVDLLRYMRASLARSALPEGMEDPAQEGSQHTY